MTGKRQHTYCYHVRNTSADIDRKYCTRQKIVEDLAAFNLTARNCYHISKGNYAKKFAQWSIEDIREPVKPPTPPSSP